MRKLFFILPLLFITLFAKAQQTYVSSVYKLIFSTAPNIERNGVGIKSPVRFSGFFNYGLNLNVDFNNVIGISIGAEIKNIGMILKDSAYHTKHRCYAVGVPIALRIGNLKDRWWIFAGGQYDYQFGYKEKLFYDDSKTKRVGAYDNDVNPFMPSVFAGIKFKSGMSLGAHYMLDNFFAKDYRFKDPKNNNTPYNSAYTNSQILYFSVGFSGDFDKITKEKSPAPAPNNNRNASYIVY
jgi:hypothetical protein